MSWRDKAQIAVRHGDLELLSCDKQLGYAGIQTHMEISKWTGDSRCVIAVFYPVKDGHDLRFVDDRPLSDNIDWDEFKRMIKLGFELSELLERDDEH